MLFIFRPLHSGFFYELGQFGELGDGERHLLQSNGVCAPVKSTPSDLPTINRSHESRKGDVCDSSAMIMTFDGGWLSGIIVDAAESRYQCSKHHSQLYRFCPSTVAECICEPSSLALCSNVDGSKIFVACCSKCQKEASLEREPR